MPHSRPPESHFEVVAFLRERGISPAALENVIGILEGSPRARWATVTFSPSVFVRQDDPDVGRGRVTLKRLVEAAENGTLAEVKWP